MHQLISKKEYQRYESAKIQVLEFYIYKFYEIINKYL